MKRVLVASGLLGALAVLGVYLGVSLFGLIFGGAGAGSGGGPEQAPPKPEPKAVETIDLDDVIADDGVLEVRIEGPEYFVAGRKSSLDEILAAVSGKRARVKIVRADDATRRAREELAKGLAERRVPYELD